MTASGTSNHSTILISTGIGNGKHLPGDSVSSRPSSRPPSPRPNGKITLSSRILEFIYNNSFPNVTCWQYFLLILVVTTIMCGFIILPEHVSCLKVQVPQVFMKTNVTMSANNVTNSKYAPIPRFHYKARGATYPRNDSIKRFPVPDAKVPWLTDFPEYAPVDYTAPSVTSQPVWADFDIRTPGNEFPIPQYNLIDGQVDRRSLTGPYQVIKNIPRNPVGRTGVTGRGLLGRWGPNHAADPIVTRWKTIGGKKVLDMESRKPILQFIAIQRRDSGEWALPGGMVDPGETINVTLLREFGEEALNSLEASPVEREELQQNVSNFFKHNGKEGMVSPGEHISETLKREFGEETMNSLEATEDEKKQISRLVADLFSKGIEVYRGYVDDPRNTDNAWMETMAFNFHDETGHSVGRFKLHAGDDAVGVRWTDINKNLRLYASHSEFIHKVVQLHKANW